MSRPTNENGLSFYKVSNDVWECVHRRNTFLIIKRKDAYHLEKTCERGLVVFHDRTCKSLVIAKQTAWERRFDWHGITNLVPFTSPSGLRAKYGSQGKL